MPFTKGNNLWDNPRVKAYQFKEGERISLSTEFKAGFAPWNKGLKGYKAGESHYKWKVDRTQLARKQERNDGAYKEWRRQVWVRDGYKCKISNLDCAGRIEAHHILGWTKYPELRYVINNGITLCHFHHPRKKEDEKSLSPYFQRLVEVELKQLQKVLELVPKSNVTVLTI